MKATFLWVSLAAAVTASAQLTGSVGPTTTREAKAAKKVCNILNYGGVASATTDNGPALTKAWNDCKAGGQVLIPPGSYGMATWVALSGGKGVSVNLEGVIYRMTSGTAGGNMIAISNSDDVEFYSGNSKGAVQGYGYQFLSQNKYGPRILRFIKVTNFSVHDIALVDSPAFHFTMDTCTNGEVYNLIIRGADRGGLDGVDIWGNNIWVHDVEVTNRDECVTSPANGILVENVFCNLSGGCAIGSLGADTDIKNIVYRNIYTQNSNQMMMIKSRGGSGTLQNAQFLNFMGHSNAYTLNLDSNWSSQAAAAGNGVQYKNLSFSNWRGTCSDGTRRAPIQVLCPAQVPCSGINIKNVNIWTEAGSSEVYKCANAYGSGGCLKGGSSLATYTTTVTVQQMDASSYAITKMPGEITNGLGISVSIAIPAVPTTFFPGQKPASALMGQ